MADENPEKVEVKKVKVEVEGKEALNELTQGSNDLSSAFNNLYTRLGTTREEFQRTNEVYKTYSNLMGKLSSETSLMSDVFKKGSATTNTQAAAISMLSSKLVKANELFNNFGSGINLNNVHSFTEQFNEFSSVIKNVFEAGKDLTPDKLQEKIKQSLGFVIPIDQIMKGADAVLHFMEANLQSADASLRLREAILQSAAATGQLDSIYSSAGDELQNLNGILSQHTEILSKTLNSVNLDPKTVNSYYAALSKIPGMMNSVITTSDKNSEKLSALTATIQLAQGQNRDYESVIRDVNSAFVNYNANLEEALNYTGRVSEVSNRLGIDLRLVEDFAGKSAETFGKFGNNTDASAKILLNYGKGLREVGASGAQAVSIVKEMESSISNLTMSQKAFLSSQSGGPGGLMGAFRIEKLLKEGKSDEVFEMIRKQITKQFGKTITLEEASSSPQLAAQYQRQRQLLSQGPLGGLVKSEGDMNRVMEMFKRMETGEFKKENLKDKSYEEYMKKGRILSEQTQTPFGMMAAMATEQAMKASNTKYNIVQNTFAAKSGSQNYNYNENNEMKSNMIDRAREARSSGYSAVQNLNEDIQTSSIKDRSNQYLGKSIKESYDFTKQAIPATIKAPFVSLRSMLSNKPNSPENEEENLNQIQKTKETTKIINRNIEATQLPRQAAVRDVMASSKKEDQKQKEKEDIKPPSVQKTEVDVKVTGVCIDCGKKMKESAHVRTANPAGTK